VDQQISLTQCISHTLEKYTLCVLLTLSEKYYTCIFLALLPCSLFFFFKPFFSCSQTLVCFFKLTEVPFYRPSFMLHGQQSPSSGFPATTFLHQALLLSTNGTIFLTCLVKDQLPAKTVLGFPFFSPSRSSLVNKCEPPSRSSLVNKCEPQ
jgi:hypothetical protein